MAGQAKPLSMQNERSRTDANVVATGAVSKAVDMSMDMDIAVDTVLVIRAVVEESTMNVVDPEEE